MAAKKMIVIGGGAAGFFCAVNAARLNPALQVTLLEKTGKLLSKVKVSGGGRCNVTHACFDIGDMSRRYPRGQHFVKKMFHRFFTTDTIQWFEERGVKLKTEADGRMFPVTDSSQTIVNCLLNEADRYNVKIETGAAVTSLQRREDGFVVKLSGDQELTADYLCIACGGYPKASMFDWLRATGHTIEEPVPSLFTFNLPGHPLTQLMGVSVEQARVKISGTKLEQEGPLLITHWGLSGPVVLRLSAWGARELAAGNYSFGISVNWLPAVSEQQLAEQFRVLRLELASRQLGHKNPFALPQRLWEFLLGFSGIKAETRWADLPAKDQNRLIRNLCSCELQVAGKTTFKEEFVTAGGIRLSEIDPQTMQSRKVPHLYFAGEILDVDGITGGFNFQHAWSSGMTAAAALTIPQ
ncbi:MAG: NAD(P)/FAD-dependent oxidoreductase [Chitinophagaceae bacterium]